MGWSTRKLAELSGTTLRAVRHYHDLGLLEEPERTANGYKHYGVTHLARVLRIRRLVDLGMTLQQIGELDDSLDPQADELRRLDDELRATIERLQTVREGLAPFLADSPLVDLPPELAFAEADESIPELDRRLLLVLSRLLDPEALRELADYRRAVPVSPEERELDGLPADADERTRQDLAERSLATSLEVRVRWPRLPDLVGPRAPDDLRAALADIYNPAQIDVLERLVRMRAELRAASPG